MITFPAVTSTEKMLEELAGTEKLGNLPVCPSWELKQELEACFLVPRFGNTQAGWDGRVGFGAWVQESPLSEEQELFAACHRALLPGCRAAIFPSEKRRSSYVYLNKSS